MKPGLREAVFFVMLLGLLAAAYFLGFQRINERRTEMLADVEKREQDLTRLSQSTGGIQNLNSRIENIQAAIEYFEDKLPKAKEVEKILPEVWKLALEHGLEIADVVPRRVEVGPSYNTQPIDISLSGEFKPGFYGFLLKLEQLDRIIRITGMELTRIDSQAGTMEARCTLVIFFEPETSGAVADIR
ncbi:MAG: type 4a pilus biogenesis protein PilO [Phycisphaerae bacterium]